MDYDSSSKFISSLAKFLQSLCNGYVEFDSGVQVIGHLYLSVDTGKTIDYVLNEKVCKTDENSVTFISNSFHAQPAEKPKPPGKRSTKDSEKTDLKNEDDSDNINAQGEPRSTNVGTVPSRSINQNSPHSQSSKRPYSPPHKQSQLKSGHASPKHKKSKTELIEQNTPSQLSNPASENSISSAPSPAADIGPSHSAQSSDALHGSQLGESYPQSFFHPDDENSLADESEERDIKPTIDTDVTFIKEEFAPSSSCSQSGSQSHDRPHGDDSSLYPYQSNQVFSPYAGSGGFGASQRSNFSSSGSAHMFSSNSGQGSSKIEGEGPVDPSDLFQSAVKIESGVKFKVNRTVLSRKVSQPSGLIKHARAFDDISSQKNNSDMETAAVEDDKQNETTSDQESSVSDYHWLGGNHSSQQPNANGMFECETCGKAYSYRRCLQRHLWQCNQMRQLKCTLCDKEFYRSDKLRNHMRHLHRVELPRKTPSRSTAAFQKDQSADTSHSIIDESPCLSDSELK
uniref:C2H2-type domain-containing protein n=1 Tax=Arion vulgaris TaxID=1028688 RepID=A0A0B7B1K8_9EUPU